MVAAALLIGAPLIYLLDANQHIFQQWLINHPADITQKLNWLIMTLFFVVTLPSWVAGFYFWRLGARIVRAERFPLAGARLVRDTPVITGKAARRRGKLLQILAAVLVLSAAALPVMLMQLVRAIQ